MKNVAIYLVVLVFWQIHINTSISMGRNKTYQDLLQMVHAVVIKLTYMNNYNYIYIQVNMNSCICVCIRVFLYLPYN